MEKAGSTQAYVCNRSQQQRGLFQVRRKSKSLRLWSGPISVWHYNYPVQLPELPQAPGYSPCSQSVQMNSFTQDQGGENDLLTPSGEKGKVYAHKNDIPEHSPSGSSWGQAKVFPQSSTKLCWLSSAQITAPEPPTAPSLPGKPLNKVEQKGPGLPGWCALGCGNSAGTALAAVGEPRHFSHSASAPFIQTKPEGLTKITKMNSSCEDTGLQGCREGTNTSGCLPQGPAEPRAVLLPGQNWTDINNQLTIITTAKEQASTLRTILRCCSAIPWHLDRACMFLEGQICKKLILHQTLLGF